MRLSMINAIVAAALGASLVGLSGAAAAAVGSVQPLALTYLPLTNYNSGKCLDLPESSSDDGQGLEQYQCNGGANQKWALQYIDSDTSGNYYRIVNQSSGKCVDVRDRSSDNNAVVVQNGCNTQFSQQWKLNYVADNTLRFQLVARHSLKCATVANSSTANKAGILQYSCGTSVNWNQYWLYG
ncbi:RICIN domain-containing protein [Streptomyces prunicolor]|uniref:RICIN domain-containing protein n=1 Tax=Streptomyces prunicolor TaxID=67348 RepID=UPI0033DA357F